MKKKELKLLIVSDTIRFREKTVIEALNHFCRRKFDAVICIGDNTPVVIQEADILYPKTAKLCVCGDKTPLKTYIDRGYTDINNKVYNYADTTFFGYCSHRVNPRDDSILADECRADIFIPYHNPMGINVNHEVINEDADLYPEVNKYIKKHKPLYVLHGTQKQKKVVKYRHGFIRSCDGVLALTIHYDKMQEIFPHRDF